MRARATNHEPSTPQQPPVNLVQAKVERSLLCMAIGQVTFNLTLSVARNGRTRTLSLAPRTRLSRLTTCIALAALLLVQGPKALGLPLQPAEASSWLYAGVLGVFINEYLSIARGE